MLRSFLGTDTYGGSFVMKSGASLYEPKIADPANPKYRAGVTDVPNSGVYFKLVRSDRSVVVELHLCISMAPQVLKALVTRPRLM